MKILAIIGSPRKNGNTEILINEAMEGAKGAGAKTEILNIGEMDIGPCRGCAFCLEGGECSISDDMQHIYPKLLEADGIFIGTPVYFWNVSAQVKILIDRTYHLMVHRKLRGKVGGIAVVANRAGCGNAYSSLNDYFALMRMTLAGGVIGYADEPGDIRGDSEAMSQAGAAGKAMVKAIQRSST
ncbi:MAG: flavodoxin family protein [Dehalococcoidia bacterium]